MQDCAWKLEQFNKRASFLDSSRFLSWVRSNVSKQPDVGKLLKGDWLVYEGLSREDLDSFILNFRLLIQGRDGYSIRCLSEIYGSLPEDYASAKHALESVRKMLNGYLNSSSTVKLKVRGKTSKRTVMETILYGGFAHTNPRHYKNFVALTTSGAFSLFTFFEFVNILSVVNDYIQRIAVLNGEVLGWLAEG